MPVTWKWPQPAPMKLRELQPIKLTEREEI